MNPIGRSRIIITLRANVFDGEGVMTPSYVEAALADRERYQTELYVESAGAIISDPIVY